MSDPQKEPTQALDTLTGVVEPQFPGMPEPPSEEPLYLHIYDNTVSAVEATLLSTRETLSRLRQNREVINDHIRQLVAEEKRLASMLHIATKKAEQ